MLKIGAIAKAKAQQEVDRLVILNYPPEKNKDCKFSDFIFNALKIETGKRFRG